MKGLVFDSSFPLVFFLINLVSFQSFLGSWLHFYNGPSKSKICGISAGVCSAAAEGGPEGLSRNATGRVGTCWNSLCPEGSWRIIIHHDSLCFILFHIMMPLDASTEFDYRVSFFLESDISLCICVALSYFLALLTFASAIDPVSLGVSESNCFSCCTSANAGSQEQRQEPDSQALKLQHALTCSNTVFVAV